MLEVQFLAKSILACDRQGVQAPSALKRASLAAIGIRLTRMDQDQLDSFRQALTSLRQEIELLAYHLWEERGCPDDSGLDDWKQAEQQVLASRRA